MNIGDRSKIECVTHNIQHRPHTGKCIIRLVGKSSIKMMYHTNLTTCAQKKTSLKKKKNEKLNNMNNKSVPADTTIDMDL